MLAAVFAAAQSFRVSIQGGTHEVLDELDRYLIQLRGDGLSPHTVKQVARFVRMLVVALRDPEIADVQHEHIAGLLASDVVAKRADGGIRRSLRPLMRNHPMSSGQPYLSGNTVVVRTAYAAPKRSCTGSRSSVYARPSAMRVREAIAAR